MLPTAENIVACGECDLLQRVPEVPPGATARCPRCGHEVASNRVDSLNRTLALATAAAVTLVIANVMPLMGLSVSGRQASTTILGGAAQMWLTGQQITALLVMFCTVVAPAVHIGIMFTVALVGRRNPVPSYASTLLHWSEWHKAWAMVEVMILGILVALIKIADLAIVTPGIGMFAVGALVVLVAAMTVTFDPDEIWQRIEWAHGGSPSRAPAAVSEAPPQNAPADGATGIMLGLGRCEHCGLLSKPAGDEHSWECPRCGEEVAFRKSNSIQRTWALLISALICYIPANVYPVMVTETLVYSEDDTILSGVVLLYNTGSWHLALIVLIASVMIPLAKIGALAYLLITVQRGSIEGQRDRIKLYRVIEFVGRWSMLDVFVVTFTVALIQMQPLMSIKPGAGVFFFASVVVLTMLAAESLDPRFIWDSSNESGGNHE